MGLVILRQGFEEDDSVLPVELLDLDVKKGLVGFVHLDDMGDGLSDCDGLLCKRF